MSYVKVNCPNCGDPVRQPLAVHPWGDTVHVVLHRRTRQPDCRVKLIITSTGGASGSVIRSGPKRDSLEDVLEGSTRTGFAREGSTR